MNELQAVYKSVAVAVWQLCNEQPLEDWIALKPILRVKAKGKTFQKFSLKHFSSDLKT